MAGMTRLAVMALAISGIALAGCTGEAITGPEASDTIRPQALSSGFDCSSTSGIPVSECEALVALYESAGGADWFDATNWLTSSTPCSWFGVTCEGGTVFRLFLYGNNLIGTLPAEIAQLEGLDILRLENNRLSGPIPAEIGNMASLGLLGLAYNELSGSIPSELGNLSLSALYLLENRLSGSIPTELANIATLQAIDLSGNLLTGAIPAEFGGMPDLRSIVLSRNQLSGQIPEELGNLPSLSELDLASNSLEGAVPLLVAQAGAAAAYCDLRLNPDLTVPDLPAYRALADAAGTICNLPLTSVDPAEMFRDEVADLAEAGSLNSGQTRALLRKLEQAEDQAAADRSGSAIAILDGLIAQIADFVEDGVLSAVDGGRLIDLVWSLRESLAES